MSLISIRAVFRPLALAAIVVPFAFASATAIAETLWHGWTYVDSGGNTQFNKLVVTLANTGGGVTMRQVATTSIPGVTIANAPANGYTLNWPVATPFKKGETVTAQFNALAGAKFQGATAFNGAVVVGTIDIQGVLKAPNGAKLGELAPALAVKAGPAEQAIIDRINNWGATLGAAQPTLGAHADAMAGLYTGDASLLPTFGIYALYRNLDYKPAEPNAPVIRNYFRHAFLPKKPKMLPLNLGALHVVVDNDLASANGLYTFKTSADECGNAKPEKAAHARFTFVFKKVGNVWTVVQHHSSANPNDAALAPAKKLCLGDMNSDGTVDGADIGLLLAAWGGVSICGDLNDDGTVDGADLGLMLGAFGNCP